MASAGVAFEFAVEPELPAGPRHRPELVEQKGLERATEVDVAALAPSFAALRRDEFRVILDVESDRGEAELELPLRVENRGAARWSVHGVAYHLTLDINIGPDGGEIQWRLDPGGRDAAARARIVDLLHALSGRGVLVLRDPDTGVLARLQLNGHSEIDGLLAERAFLTDVLVLEAWSGVRLPVPDEPDEESLDQLAQLAAVVRAEGLRVRFTSNITGVTSARAPEADELRLGENIEYPLWTLWVPLGQAHYHVRVRVTAMEPALTGGWRVTFEPAQDWLWAPLEAPTRGASERVRMVHEGLFPDDDIAGRRLQEDALRRATQLAAEWELDEPEDQAIREQLRRRWPT